MLCNAPIDLGLTSRAQSQNVTVLTDVPSAWSRDLRTTQRAARVTLVWITRESAQQAQVSCASQPLWHAHSYSLNACRAKWLRTEPRNRHQWVPAPVAGFLMDIPAHRWNTCLIVLPACFLRLTLPCPSVFHGQRFNLPRLR